MMKKISRRSFLQVCGITAATAALTACGGGKTETAKKDDVHEAITFMAPYKEIEAFIEQVHSVYPSYKRAFRSGLPDTCRWRSGSTCNKAAAERGR